MQTKCECKMRTLSSFMLSVLSGIIVPVSLSPYSATHPSTFVPTCTVYIQYTNILIHRYMYNNECVHVSMYLSILGGALLFDIPYSSALSTNGNGVFHKGSTANQHNVYSKQPYSNITNDIHTHTCIFFTLAFMSTDSCHSIDPFCICCTFNCFFCIYFMVAFSFEPEKMY